jgi:hypothetical protein
MGLRVDKKSGMLLVVLSLVLTYLTPYTASAYSIAPHVLDADTPVWASAPSGSFFPWPKRPGILEILSEMNGVDKFIYLYLIKSWALVGVAILLWAVMILYILRLANRLYHSPA